MTNRFRVSLHTRRVACWLFACLFAATAAAQEATDAGLVNQSTGAVAYAAKDGVSHPVQAFMKVLPKDTKRGWGKTLRGTE